VEESPDEAARIVQLVMPPQEVEPPVPPAPETPTDSTRDHNQAMNDPHTDQTPVPHATNDHSPHNTPHGHNAPSDADIEAQAQHIAGLTMNSLAHQPEFNALVAVRTGAGGVADVMAQGAFMNDTLRDLQNSTGIDNRTPGIQRGSLVAQNAFGHGNQLGHGLLTHSTGSDVNTGTQQQIVARVPTGRVIVQPPPDPGPDVPIDQIAAVVRHNLGGLQWCYTQGLRNHPTLQGRIEVHFTIGTSGRITASPGIDGFEEAPEVRQCVQGRFRSMVFPQQSDPVELSFPFQFLPGT
jgi:hypothetical protein